MRQVAPRLCKGRVVQTNKKSTSRCSFRHQAGTLSSEKSEILMELDKPPKRGKKTCLLGPERC